MEAKNDFTLELIKTVEEIKPRKIIAGNNSYLIFLDAYHFVYLYDLENKKQIKLDGYSSNAITKVIKMHPNFQNIFIYAKGNTAIIYEIIPKSLELTERNKVTGFNEQIELVEFSQKSDKIFATYSSDKTLKVWDLNSAFCLCNILLNEPIMNFQFFGDSLFYIDMKNFYLTECKYKTLTKINYEEIKSPDFMVLKDNLIMLIDGNILTKYSNGKKMGAINIKHFIESRFYDEKLNLLFFLSGLKIYVLDINNMTIMFEKQTFCSELIYIKNYLNNEKINANLIIIKGDIIEYYYLGKKKINNEQKQQNKLIVPDKDFWGNTIPSISDINNLLWEQNIYEEFSYPKYLNNDLLDDEIKKNNKKKLSEKKQEVEKEINSDENENFDYIQLLKMLIKDNTNQKVIQQYLKTLKKDKEGEIKIDFEGNEIYDSEYEKYKNLFTIDELKSNGLEEKVISTKDDFLGFLKDILEKKEKDIKYLKETVKQELENVQIFNQPIDFENEELYWYRNRLILYFALDKIIKEDEKNNIINNNQNNNNIINNNTNNNKYKRFELMQKNIKEIIKRNLLKDDSIIGDKTLLTTLMIIIAIPLPLDLLEFNLNLIYTKSKNYKFEDELAKHNLTSTNEDDYLMKVHKKNPKTSNTCLANFELNISKKMNLDEIELNNYDFMKQEFNKIIDFNKMYTFLSKIVCSPVFREAFKILYPDDFKFPFNGEKDSKDFLEKYLKFIPFKSDRTSAVTEKFSLEIYIFLKVKNINFSHYFEYEIKNIIIKILYLGSCVVDCSHEMNHEFYNIFLKHSNGKIPLETPRKQYIEEREGGRNMERLLFNRRAKKISLIECMYLLNERNYNKSLDKFREGLNEPKNEDIKMDTDCVFYELNQIFNINDFNNFSRSTIISCDDNSDYSDILKDSCVNNLENDNDVLGFLRDPLYVN